jgi:hypothetical protein
MKLEIIEKKALRAVVIVLAGIAVIAVGLALWSRYHVFSEQRELELRREYEQRMAEAMEQELLVEGMSRGVVRATLGPPDSIWGQGELTELWFYSNTSNYEGVWQSKFERGYLTDHKQIQAGAIPPDR